MAENNCIVEETTNVQDVSVIEETKDGENKVMENLTTDAVITPPPETIASEEDGNVSNSIIPEVIEGNIGFVQIGKEKKSDEEGTCKGTELVGTLSSVIKDDEVESQEQIVSKQSEKMVNDVTHESNETGIITTGKGKDVIEDISSVQESTNIDSTTIQIINDKIEDKGVAEVKSEEIKSTKKVTGRKRKNASEFVVSLSGKDSTTFDEVTPKRRRSVAKVDYTYSEFDKDIENSIKGNKIVKKKTTPKRKETPPKTKASSITPSRKGRLNAKKNDEASGVMEVETKQVGGEVEVKMGNGSLPIDSKNNSSINETAAVSCDLNTPVTSNEEIPVVSEEKIMDCTTQSNSIDADSSKGVENMPSVANV